MELNSEGCYQALLTHDARFDGAFYVGVASTRIYCRTICPARTPRRENCSFYPTAAAAEQSGFRPCLRCRPELAPGSAGVDASARIAARAAARIEDGALTDGGVEALAAGLGISGRHLRRVVESAYGVSPIALAQTQRLLLAKRLLTDTGLTATEVAFASGFSSVRRFNALFRARYRLNPSDLRDGQSEATRARETVISELSYRPPLDWDWLLRFVGARAVAGVEAVVDGRYLRTVRVNGARGWIAVGKAAGRNALQVEMSVSLAGVIPATLGGVRRLFDLSAHPMTIAKHLGSLAEAAPGVRVPGAFDGFELAVRAILGQQISVRAATTLAARIAARFGDEIETPFPPLIYLFPAAERIAAALPEEIVAMGIIGARARSIQALAQAVATGKIILDGTVDVPDTLARLTTLPGIGEWTAHYIAMRALGWPDAFPHADLGIAKAMGETNPKRVLKLAEGWRPWRAYAAMHLWKSLENQR